MFSLNEYALEIFEKHRKEIKKPLTDRARKMAINKLRQMPPELQMKAVEQSVLCRWTGIFPPSKYKNSFGKPDLPTRLRNTKLKMLDDF